MDFYHPFSSRMVYDDGRLKLATYGLGDYMLTKKPYRGSIGSFKVLDVRHIQDGPGNGLDAYRELIGRGCRYLDQHKRLVVCCVAGISRSNAVAMGILMSKFGMDHYEAMERVQDTIKNCHIEQAHLKALKALFGVKVPLGAEQWTG